MNKMTKIRLAVLAASVSAMGAANAAVDTSGVTAAISDSAAAVAVVGAAVLVLVVGTKVFKWIARAL